MITGLGIGLVGFGLILVYAGVTGQHVKEQLAGVFTKTKPTGTHAALVPILESSTAPPPTVGTGAHDTGNILTGSNPLPVGRTAAAP